MLPQLRERHSGLLASGKSGQQASAQAADRSCAALSSTTIRQGRYNILANFFLMSAFIGILLVFLSRQQVAQVRLLHLEDCAFVVALRDLAGWDGMRSCCGRTRSRDGATLSSAGGFRKRRGQLFGGSSSTRVPWKASGSRGELFCPSFCCLGDPYEMQDQQCQRWEASPCLLLSGWSQRC